MTLTVLLAVTDEQCSPPRHGKKHIVMFVCRNDSSVTPAVSSLSGVKSLFGLPAGAVRNSLVLNGFLPGETCP